MDLRKLLGIKSPSPASLEKALDTARAEEAAAAVEVQRLTGGRRELLLTADDRTVAEHDTRLEAAKRQRDRAAVMVEELERRLADANAADAERAKVRAYEDLELEASALRTWLSERYDLLAAELAEHVSRIPDLERRIDETNRNLPTGKAQIGGVERVVRRAPGSSEALPLADVLVLPALIGGHLYAWPPNVAE